MEILLVGNKPSAKVIDYENYDLICQVNRMCNIMHIPRVDIWYCDCHPFFFCLPSKILKSKCDLTKTQVLIPLDHCHNSSKLLELYPKIDKNNVQLLDVGDKMFTNVINGQQTEKNMLTSDVIFLLYLLEQYPNDNITLSYLDVDGRGEILSNQDTHKYTGHKNAVFDEEVFLRQLIETEKIKYINI